MALSGTRLRGLVTGLGDLYAAVGHGDYPARVISTVSGLIATGSCSYNHLDGSRVLAYDIEPWDVVAFPDADALFRQHLPEHPVLAHAHATSDGSACRISDVASDRQFRGLGLYRDFYRPAEVEYQMCFLTPHPNGGTIALALNRKGRDFADEDRELLDLLRPHIAQAAALAAALSHPVPDGPDGPDGQPLLTPRQTRILQLVAEGHPDRAVARSLGISTRTVNAHLQHIYRALGVTSRTEALARLRELRQPQRSAGAI